VPVTTERADERGLQHRLSVPIVEDLAAAFHAQLAAEAAHAPPGTLSAWRAQFHSFAGGGALWMDSWGPADGMLSWHARSFLRLALRQSPEGVSTAEWAAWRCTTSSSSVCRSFCASGIFAVAHASSCGEASRRHHAYATAAREVLLAFPGRPQIRVEVPGVPAAGCQMDAVVVGATFPAPPPPCRATAAAATAGSSGPGAGLSGAPGSVGAAGVAAAAAGAAAAAAPAAAGAAGATTSAVPGVAGGGGGAGVAPGVADSRQLLVDFSVVEPVAGRMLNRGAGSHTVPGLAAAHRSGEKVQRYGALVDAGRQRLLPWVVETWGRHDADLVVFLRGAARLAAFARAPPPAASADDAAEARRIGRLAGAVFATWMQRLSAGVVVSVAEHLDARFRPLRGSAARQAFRGLVPSGLAGRCPLDQGVLGVSGHVRSMEPRFAFTLPPCC
jgi:hypothetical protein